MMGGLCPFALMSATVQKRLDALRSLSTDGIMMAQSARQFCRKSPQASRGSTKSVSADCRATAPPSSWAGRAREERIRAANAGTRRPQTQASRDLRRVRRKHRRDFRECRRLRLGPARAGAQAAVLHERATLACLRGDRRLRSRRHAGHARGEATGNRRAVGGVRRHRRAAVAAAHAARQDARNLPLARLADASRADRHHHDEDRRRGRERRRSQLRFHAVHGRLRGAVRPPHGTGNSGAPARDLEISRLGFRARRISAELRSARHGSGVARSHRHSAGSLDRARVDGLRRTRSDAGRWLVPRQQHADHRRTRHIEDHTRGTVRRKRLSARRAHAVRELRRGRRARPAQSQVGRHSISTRT